MPALYSLDVSAVCRVPLICGQEDMGSRLLVSGAGTGVGNNVLRSLRVGDPGLILVGCHHDRFVLKKSTADSNYLVHESTHPLFLESVRRVIERERIDLLIPTSDRDVRVCSDLRGAIPCRVFLPSPPTIALCQDKYELATHLKLHGVGPRQRGAGVRSIRPGPSRLVPLAGRQWLDGGDSGQDRRAGAVVDRLLGGHARRPEHRVHAL